jgi:hypothetical protein
MSPDHPSKSILTWVCTHHVHHPTLKMIMTKETKSAGEFCDLSHISLGRFISFFLSKQ